MNLLKYFSFQKARNHQRRRAKENLVSLVQVEKLVYKTNIHLCNYIHVNDFITCATKIYPKDVYVDISHTIIPFHVRITADTKCANTAYHDHVYDHQIKVRISIQYT